MSSVKSTYDVNIVFRGLFLALPSPQGLRVLLPDGRNPHGAFHEPEPAAPQGSTPTPEELRKARLRELHRQIGPYNHHQGMLEFRAGDWRNPSLELPGTVQVRKPIKGEVAITQLGLTGSPDLLTDFVRFSSARERPIGPPEELRAPRGSYNTTTPASDPLFVLDEDHALSFQELPPFTGKVRADAWQQSVAFCLFDRGEVTTERRSRRGTKPLRWTFIEARHFAGGIQGVPLTDFRPINLDLRVRFALELNDTLVIDLEPFQRRPPRSRLPDGDSAASSETQSLEPVIALLPRRNGRTFLLRPEDPSRGLEIWIKNRELDRVLAETDLNPEPFRGCEHDIESDRDHGLLMELVEDPDTITIPFLQQRGTADCGAACGGCGGGGGG